MLHTKFHGNQSSGSGEDWLRVFTIYGHGGQWPCWSCDPDATNKFRSPFPRRLHIKFGFDWQSGFGDV